MNVDHARQVGRGRGSGREAPARTVKVTVTVPADLVEAATARVQADQAASLSAYVSRALKAQLESDEERDAFLAFLDRLDEELGAPSEEDYAWARRFASQ